MHNLLDLCDWWGIWLQLGRRTTYSYFNAACFSRQVDAVAFTFENLQFLVEDDDLHIFPYSQCCLILRQAFPGAVTRHGDVLLSCNALVLTLTYNLINAVRFSDGLGLQNRSRYEAGCYQFTAMVGTLQQLKIFWMIGKRYDGIT